jgi:hypothetical protein
MKKTIYLGICVSIIALLVVPTIPAQEYTQVKQAYERVVEDYINSLEKALTNEGLSPQERLQQILDSSVSLKEFIDSQDEEIKPEIIGFILKTIISLLFSLIGTIFGILFGPILAFVVLLLTSPAIFLAKIIAFLFGKEISFVE